MIRVFFTQLLCSAFVLLISEKISWVTSHRIGQMVVVVVIPYWSTIRHFIRIRDFKIPNGRRQIKSTTTQLKYKVGLTRCCLSLNIYSKMLLTNKSQQLQYNAVHRDFMRYAAKILLSTSCFGLWPDNMFCWLVEWREEYNLNEL